MGLLDVLESIAEVPDRQIVYLLTFFFLSSVSVTVSQASTITAEGITMKKLQKKYHKSQRTRTGLRIPELPRACMLASKRHFCE